MLNTSKGKCETKKCYLPIFFRTRSSPGMVICGCGYILLILRSGRGTTRSISQVEVDIIIIIVSFFLIFITITTIVGSHTHVSRGRFGFRLSYRFVDWLGRRL